MRYLILSDIHSNLEALEVVLQAARDKYDSLLCCGDLIGYGPNPGEVTTCLCTLQPAVVRGNHDKAALGLTDLANFNPLARAAALWTRAVLKPEHFEYLRQIPPGPMTVGDFTIAHGSLIDEDEYLFQAAEAGASLRLAWTTVTFMGHTHVQGGFALLPDSRILTLKPALRAGATESHLLLEPGIRYLINPGSVGQPRDRDPRAAFAIYDTERGEVEYHRQAYPVEITQEKMVAAGLPEYLIHRLSVGR
jgi:predicted phosphodiesterase